MPKTYRKGTKRKILFIYFEYTKFLTVPVQNYETTERKKLMAGLAVLWNLKLPYFFSGAVSEDEDLNPKVRYWGPKLRQF